MILAMNAALSLKWSVAHTGCGGAAQAIERCSGRESRTVALGRQPGDVLRAGQGRSWPVMAGHGLERLRSSSGWIWPEMSSSRRSMLVITW